MLAVAGVCDGWRETERDTERESLEQLHAVRKKKKASP